MDKTEASKDAGNKYFKNEDYDKAIKCYMQGLEEDPSNPTLNCNVAQAFLAKKDFASAEVHAVIAITHQPDSVKAFYRASKAALGMAKKERALSYLQTGLVKCPNSEELKTLHDEICKENGDSASFNNTSVKIDSARVRSTSVSNSGNKNSSSKKSSERTNDAFLDMVVKIQSELSPDEKSSQFKEREALMKKQKTLQTYMKEGSEAFEIGIPKQASEKYKCALEIMAECNIEVFGLSEVDRIVLKYSLSICWIETLNYNNIVKSVGILMEMKTSCSENLPAVYFGLGQAYYRLNRFKMALDHLDNGFKVIESCIDIIPHRWPGTMKTIPETTRFGLEESMNKLRNMCKTYHEPDALCRYEKCLTVSAHICPSEVIFFSDPDFMGFVVSICQENCRIIYHVSCWKNHKENLSSVRKFTDKDVLGLPCLTSDCINERRELSLIVRIEVYGEDGKIKTFCAKEPSKTDNVNEHRKERKKKNEKIDRPVKVRTGRTQMRKLAANTQNCSSVKHKIAVLNTGKRVKKKPITSCYKFAFGIIKLVELRKINFGFVNEWNPQRDYFGRHDVATLESNINTYISKDSETLQERKDFIFTYFYEFLNEEGPQKISELEQKWHEDVSQFSGIEDFLSERDGICDFLLQSYRFACIDDYICISDQMADAYLRVREEVGESIAFILSNSSLPLENHVDDTDNIVDPYTDNIVDPYSNRTVPDFQVYERPDSIATTSSEACSSEVWRNKRAAELDAFTIQFTDSGSSEGETTDYEEPVLTDSESEFQYGNNPDTLDASVIELRENVSPPQSAPCTSAAVNTNQELLEEDANSVKSVISDVAINGVGLPSSCPLVLQNVDECQINYEKENEIKATLSTINIQLEQEHEKDKLISNFQKEIEDYQQKIQMYERKISSLVAEKEACENDFQCQIAIRDRKLEAMKITHQEQIDKILKKGKESSSLLKKNHERVTELNKEVEKGSKTVTCLEGQLKRSNEQVLNTKKLFGELKLNSYLSRCQEKLQCLRVMVNLVGASGSPKVDELHTAIKDWEYVEGVLESTRDLLQVQYDILSQQLKNNVSSDHLLQLELIDLPTEPHYPLEDMNNVIHITKEYILHQKPANAKNINEMDATNHNVNSKDGPCYPSPLLGTSPFHADSYHSFGFKPLLFGDNYNTFMRNIPASQSNYPFGSLIQDEALNSRISASWPSEFCGGASRNDKPNHIGVSEMPSSGLTSNMDKKMDPNALQRLGQNVESEGQGASRKVTSSAGLIPIGEAKGPVPLASRPACLDMKQGAQSQKRCNYLELLNELQKTYKVISEAELSECVSIVREKNGNKLSGLPVTHILHRVEKVLQERGNKVSCSMGMDKFGETAWGEVKDEDLIWKNDDVEKECVICHIHIDSQCQTHLQCKHTFHSECIRRWLRANSTCPICRKYTRLVDEFPPLK